MARQVFEVLHPGVALLYFVVVLVLAMSAVQPVFTALSLLGALALCAGIAGWRQALGTLRWQLPVIAVVAVANCLFVGSGSTVLVRVGSHSFYAEALAYGACVGAMLACVLLAFSNASRVLTSDKVLGVLGNAVPTVGLMTSMCLRLVPQLVRRGRGIGQAATACTAAAGTGEGGGGRRGRLAGYLRQVSVLMGWAMEDALETADAMRARGWGAATRRTSYARRRFRGLDAVACVVVGALGASSAAAAWTACARFSFYPALGGWAPWYAYLPYALLVFLPILAGLAFGGEER